jgi:tetratricopeptide (TPR) repeat protein
MMKNDFNPDRPVEHFPNCSDDALARAWEELIDGPTSQRDSFVGGSAETVLVGRSEMCPEAGEWLSIVCGQVSAELRDGLLAHAARCYQCAERLRQGMQLLSSETTVEEAQFLAQMEASTPVWRHKMAVELANTPYTQKRRWFSGPPLWAGVALAASLTLAVGIAIHWQHENQPEQLLAQAYTQSRSFDLRMAGAGYADLSPATHLRGGPGSQKPAALLQAQTRISERLAKSPTDPRYLQLQARADLMQEKFDPAIAILDSLLAKGSVSSALLVDDASAYFQRGIVSDSESDRSIALDDLRRADEMSPGDPLVLFNEAVVLEDRGQQMNAVETWNRYLRFERDPRWLAEGRKRLQAIEMQLQPSVKH